MGAEQNLRELCIEKKLKNIVRVDNVKTLCVDSDKETSAAVSTRWHVIFWSFSYRRLIGPVVYGLLVRCIRCLDRWQMFSLSVLYGQLDIDKRDNLVQSSGGWFLGQVCGVILC